MEENKRTQVFSGGNDFRSGKNLVNLRGNAQTDVSSSVPQAESLLTMNEQMEISPRRDSTGSVSLNFFDRIFEYGIYLMILLMPIFILPFSFEVQEFNKYFLLIMMSSLLLFIWVLNSVFVKGQVLFFKSSITLPFGIFLLVLVLSALFGVDKLSSLLGYYGTFSDSVVFFAALFVFYLLSLSLIAQRGADRVVGRIIDMLIYSSILAAMVSLLYFVGVKFLPGFSGVGAGFNTASSYLNAFAVYLAVMLFVAIYDFFSSRKISSIGKAIDFIAVALILVNLVLIDWAVVFLVIFIFLAISIISGGFFAKRDSGMHSGLFASILLVVFSVIAGSNIDFSNVASGQLALKESSISSSIRSALSINQPDNLLLNQKDLASKEAKIIASGSLKSSPVLGSGVGTYYYDFSKYRSADFNYDENWSVRFGKAYNEILEKFSTIGILGILSYLLLVLSTILVFRKNIQKDKRDVFLLAAFLVALACQFLFLETAILKFLFVLLLIIASGRSLVGENRIMEGTLPMKGQKKILALGMNGKLSGKIFPIFAIAIVLVCSATLFLGVQAFRAEAKYKALSANADVNSVDSSKLEEVTNLNPYKGEYSLGLSRIYITRTNSLLASFGEGNQDLEKIKSESDKTVYHARRATELSANNVSFWENYGYVYRRMSDLGMQGADDWAIKGFESALKLDPNNATYKTEIGKIYLQRYLKTEGDEQKMNLSNAQAAFEEAIALKNDYPDAVTELALVYFYNDDKAKALETVKKASELKKISVATAVQIGKIYYNLEKPTEAEDALKAALRVNNDNSDAHYILGIIYKEAQRNSEALSEFKIVLEMNPGNKDVNDKISELESLINEKENK